MNHDDRCEMLPGGDYHGMTIGPYSSDPMPCHCPARAQGRARAEREIAAAVREMAETISNEWPLLLPEECKQVAEILYTHHFLTPARLDSLALDVITLVEGVMHEVGL